MRHCKSMSAHIDVSPSYALDLIIDDFYIMNNVRWILIQSESGIIRLHWNESIKQINSVAYECLSGCFINCIMQRPCCWNCWQRSDFIPIAQLSSSTPGVALMYWSLNLLLDESLTCISPGHMSVSWQPVFMCNLKLFYHCQSYTCRGHTFVCFQVCVHVTFLAWVDFRRCANSISSTWTCNGKIIDSIFLMFESAVKEFPVCSSHFFCKLQ